ncbi:Tkl protein kinase [Globisporangium polare]
MATTAVHSVRLLADSRSSKENDTTTSTDFDDRFPAPFTSSQDSNSNQPAPSPRAIYSNGGSAGDGSSPPPPPPLSMGAIVGITLACVAGVLLILGAAFWFYRKRKLTQQGLATSQKYFDATGVMDTPYTADAYAGYFRSAANQHAFGNRKDQYYNSDDNGTAFSSMLSNEGGLWDDNEIVALRIPLEKVMISSLLSRGGYGEVYFGTYKQHEVAIKLLLPEMRKDLKQINAFLAETKLMAALEHPNIVRFIGVAWDSLTDLCVVSEFMEGGDLRALLTRFETEERRPHGFDHDKVKIAFHVAHAITYLHSLDPIVLHRDLKSKNILLDGNLDAKVTDFGVSRESSDKTMTAGVGTSLWMAPEVMMGERYDDKADIFSFGVVLSELDSHGLPYAQAKSTNSGRQLPDTALLQMVSLGRLKIQLSANAPQAIADLADACTSLDPKHRPSAVEVTYKLQQALKTYENFVF